MFSKQGFFNFQPPSKTIAIRITDPNSSFITFKYKEMYFDHLELRFFDNTPDIFDPYRENFFNIKLLEKLINFFNINNGKYDNIVIHCDFGMSRSPSLSNAINHYFLNNDFELIFQNSNTKQLKIIESVFEFYYKKNV